MPSTEQQITDLQDELTALADAVSNNPIELPQTVVMGQALFCPARSAGGSEPHTFEGTLVKGKKTSAIVISGPDESAAACFKNDSQVGRAILKVCKNGEGCKITGRFGEDQICEIEGLSDSISILSVSSVRRIVPKKAKPAVRRAKRRIKKV